MTTEENKHAGDSALVQHLLRFPEDLRDIRRLQRRFRLSSREVARALDEWPKRRPDKKDPVLVQ
jgi:hypothetical protein